jgi:hypothetical protein
LEAVRFRKRGSKSPSIQIADTTTQIRRSPSFTFIEEGLAAAER